MLWGEGGFRVWRAGLWGGKGGGDGLGFEGISSWGLEGTFGAWRALSLEE